MKQQDATKEKPKEPAPEFFQTGANRNWLTGFPSEQVRPSKDSGMSEHKMPPKKNR